jgi:hypothetical protein
MGTSGSSASAVAERLGKTEGVGEKWQLRRSAATTEEPVTQFRPILVFVFLLLYLQ